MTPSPEPRSEYGDTLEEAQASAERWRSEAARSEAEWRRLGAENDRLRERAEKAEKWLRFIADTQHKLLDAIHMEVTDEEWAAFSEALELNRGGPHHDP